MRSILPVTLAVLGFVAPAAALAGANKTWVSGTGIDSGTCAITAPCKSFQYAHDQTAAGGEIDVKDAGGYGVVTITKAITIVAAAGTLATISVPQGGTGITVNAGTDDIVVLRGLTIDGHGVGLNGIGLTKVLRIIVQDCVLQGMAGAGFATVGRPTLPYLVIANVVAQNNKTGVSVTSSLSPISVSIIKSRFTANETGAVLSGVHSDIKSSEFDKNSVNGISSSNQLTIGGSSLSDQFSDFRGTNYSWGDNNISDNYTGTLTPLVKK